MIYIIGSILSFCLCFFVHLNVLDYLFIGQKHNDAIL